jgi:hypothetical protein
METDHTQVPESPIVGGEKKETDHTQVPESPIVGAGKKGMLTYQIEKTDLDLKKISSETRRYIDPADKRLLMKMQFKESPYAHFFRAWLIMGIDDQKNVKCLVPIEETIRYSAQTHGGTSLVHGSNFSIYDSLQLLPIDQRIEMETKFSISIPLVTTPYARVVFSEDIKPLDKWRYKFIPFNRRNYLLCIEPGESLSMQLQIGTVSNFSLRERTYWYLMGENGLAVETQLHRNPIDYLKVIMTQLDARLEETENNRFEKMLLKAGLGEKRDAVLAYFADMSSEIAAL